MVQRDNIKNTVKIKSKASTGILVVHATEDSFSLSLESSSPENPPPRSFIIPKSSEAYTTFGSFFQSCAKLNSASILIDEKQSIEHASIMLFSSKPNGIYIQFATEPQQKQKVCHLGKNNPRLTNLYINLFKDLQDIKRTPTESIEMSMS